MRTILVIVASTLMFSPVSASETCFTKTVQGKDINPPMCFAGEPISTDANASCGRTTTGDSHYFTSCYPGDHVPVSYPAAPN